MYFILGQLFVFGIQNVMDRLVAYDTCLYSHGFRWLSYYYIVILHLQLIVPPII